MWWHAMSPPLMCILTRPPRRNAVAWKAIQFYYSLTKSHRMKFCRGTINSLAMTTFISTSVGTLFSYTSTPASFPRRTRWIPMIRSETLVKPYHPSVYDHCSEYQREVITFPLVVEGTLMSAKRIMIPLMSARLRVAAMRIKPQNVVKNLSV
jgi:hypothetical protein